MKIIEAVGRKRITINTRVSIWIELRKNCFESNVDILRNFKNKISETSYFDPLDRSSVKHSWVPTAKTFLGKLPIVLSHLTITNYLPQPRIHPSSPSIISILSSFQPSFVFSSADSRRQAESPASRTGLWQKISFSSRMSRES